MTHTPPIPAGNQSPYPLQEPPHAKTSDAPSAPPPGDKRIAKTPEPQAVSVPTVIALAAGVGLAAIAGGLFYAFSGDKSPKRKKRKAKTKPDQA